MPSENGLEREKKEKLVLDANCRSSQQGLFISIYEKHKITKWDIEEWLRFSLIRWE